MANIGPCYICGRYCQRERHHVFNGSLRKKSEKYNAVVDLCHYCHNEPPNGVHHNRENSDNLKAEFQLKIMSEQNWTTSQFISVFYKSYSR